MAGVLRQVRDGLNPMMQVKMTSSELAARLKEWRAIHRLNQLPAGLMLDLPTHTVRGWETLRHEVYQPMLGEMLIRTAAMPAAGIRGRCPLPTDNPRHNQKLPSCISNSRFNLAKMQ